MASHLICLQHHTRSLNLSALAAVMLIQKPEMADVFDEKYGPGASAQVLGSRASPDLDDYLAW